MSYARPEILAEPDWLAEHLTDADLRVIDCGAPPAYARAHIPSAVSIGRNNFLKEPAEPGQGYGLHVMSPDAFAYLMGELGVGPDTTVVAYDDDDGRVSTRLWWVLNYYGHTKAKVLNGGWHRWLTEGREVTFHETSVSAATFEARPNDAIITRVDDLKAACASDEVQIMDTRARDEYEGTNSRGNKRVGHVPTARHLEWKEFVTTDDRRTFLPADQLQSLVDAAGFTREAPVITYCQGGIRAAHAAFVLTLLGYDDVRMYDGSMGEWANREDTPLV